MTTTIAELEKFNFPVHEEPVYVKSRVPTGHKAIVRSDTGEVLDVPSEEYKLITYGESLLPRVEKLLSQGWVLAPDSGRFGRRRPPTRLEAGGKRAYIEMILPELEFEIAGTVVYPRLTQTGSYDRTLAEHKRMGAFVLICSNGAGVFHGRQHKSTVRHIGNVDDKLNLTGADIEHFIHNFESLTEEWRAMDEVVPNRETIKFALHESLGERKAQEMLSKIGPKDTAWKVYNDITQHLTYKFEGNEDTRNDKDRKAFNILTGRVPVREVE